MTVEELIEELKKFDGNLKVAVQFRDHGGDYNGTDEDIFLYVKNNDTLIL
jgi:hypothetical protein